MTRVLLAEPQSHINDLHETPGKPGFFAAYDAETKRVALQYPAFWDTNGTFSGTQTPLAEKRHFELRDGSGYYRYRRRVPNDVVHLNGRPEIKISLNTRDFRVAADKAKALDEHFEALWAAQAAGEGGDDGKTHRAAVRLARSMGYPYMRAQDVIAAGGDEVMSRLETIAENGYELATARALLGTADEPSLTISGLMTFYRQNRAGDLEGYSPSQLKKHFQAKERAVGYLKELIGDKPLSDLARSDGTAFRDWWVNKMKAEKLTVDAVNRSISDVMGVLAVVDRTLQTDYRRHFSALGLKGTKRTKSTPRATYSPEFVQAKILQPGRLDRTNEQARLIFYALIETGARPSEICNLRPENIVLDAPIPYIDIVESDERILKTQNSSRRIPLVGVSLWAMRQRPKGFPAYRDNEDSFSATMNKALKAYGLRPTLAHTVYSIRHTFQDRVLAAGAPDRLQTDLFGHQFERPKYGEGATLEQKFELLNRIKFNWPLEIGA